MKNKYVSLAIIMLIAGSVLTGCDKSPEQKVDDAASTVKQANQDLNDAQAQYEKEWQQFKNDAETKISNNEKRLGEFKAEMKKTSANFKAKYENKVLTLEQKNIELKKKLNDYKYDGKDKWIEFKVGFNDDMDSVESALKGIFLKKN
jgi:outer membrane murein-binding lipoprotein Lpp